MPLNRDLVGKNYAAQGRFEVAREHIRQFADAIGDPNPIYRDPEAARAAGHPDVIAPPTFLTTVGLSLDDGRGDSGPIGDPELGLDYSRLVHGQQRFVHHRPVVPGDVLTMTTTIESIRAAGGNEFLSMRSDILDADGAVVSAAYNLVVSRWTGRADS